MKFTLSWLKTHLETSASLDAITDGLTSVGLEVESVENGAAKLAPFIVADVLEAKRHPNADKLQVCVVDTGSEKLQVVCGAPNARAGIKAVFAAPGTTIPRNGMLLKKGVIRGEASEGMLCSAFEMGLSDDHDGIIELPASAVVGQPFASVLGLDDPLIDIAITPDRADCLGVRGIARDLAAAGLGALRPRTVKPIPGVFKSPIAVSLDPGDTPAACPLFVGRLIRGVKNGESPEWLRNRLTSVGQRAISTLVDLTNFMTFDVNRPLHVFDASKLQGGIVVRLARSGESLAALDGKSYALTPEMTVVADSSGPLALGGIIGGTGSACALETTDVFIEAALFDPLRTARTGRTLGIHSDARHRFERGIDPAAVVEGIEEMTRLVLELCGGEPSELVIAGAEPAWRREISFRPARVQALGGVAVPTAEMGRILTDLGFGLSGSLDAEGARIQVAVPSWRGDVEGEADIVEEITRIDGYDRIAPVPVTPPSGMPGLALNPAQQRLRRLRRALAGRGLLEAVSMAFLPKALAELFGGGEPGLALANPISTDLDQMRPTPLAPLVQAVARNLARGLDQVALFEIGPGFHGDPATRPADAPNQGQDMIAAGLRARASGGRHWATPARAFDAFDAKADVLAALALMGVQTDNLAIEAAAPAWYHPGQSGVFKQGTKIIARFGMLHPSILAAVDVSAPIAAFEVLIDQLPLPKAKSSRARPLLKPSPFQPVSRDFAFVVKSDIAAAALVKAARGADKTLVTAAEVFDVYAGAGLEPGTKSLALAVTLQPTERTLTDADIEAVSAKIVASVGAATGGVLRR